MSRKQAQQAQSTDQTPINLSALSPELQALVQEELGKKADAVSKASRVILHYQGDEIFHLPDLNGKKRALPPKGQVEISDWDRIQKLPSVKARVDAGVLIVDVLE